MNIKIQKAKKSKSKLRIILEGASGSGKTYSALRIASQFGKVVVIDTERGSASLYADKFDFDVLELDAPFAPESFIEAIKACEDAGYDVIVIDSLTHEWTGVGGCLEIQSKLGGRFQDWAKVTPRHQKFIDSILTSKCHIVCTCRQKQSYVIDESTKKVTKVGLEPQQRDGLDFEMTTVFVLNNHHMAEATKDRTSLFDGKEHIITEETGKTLINWLNSGEDKKDDVKKVEVARVGTEGPMIDESSGFVKEIRRLKERLGQDVFNKILSDDNLDENNILLETDRSKQVAIYNKLLNYKE